MAGRVIGVLSAPGGVGKTTIARLLAWMARLDGKSVLLVDMDPSVSLSLYIVRKETRLVEYERSGRTLTRLLRAMFEEGVTPRLEDYVITCPHPSDEDPPVDILIPDSKLTNTIDLLWYGARARREHTLERMLRELGVRDRYDYTIVDTIPFYDRKYAVMLLYAADKCIVPLRPTTIDVYKTENMLRELPRLCDVEGEELYRKIGVVFNMYDRRSSRQARIMNLARRMLPIKVSPRVYVFENIVPRLLAFQRIGTEDEDKRRDKREVLREFKPVYEEFKAWICKQ